MQSESPLFSPLIEHAAELAAQWHDQTYRKSAWRESGFDGPDNASVRVPVIAHLTATALIVQRAGWSEEAVAAAFLHDVLEDVNRYDDRLARRELAASVGEDVTLLVEAVTEQKLDAQGQSRPWRSRKEEYLDGLKQAPAAAVAISLADKLHNLWTMNQSLEQGMLIFEGTPESEGLNAGPGEQRWFFRSVVAASEGHDDERLTPMRRRLTEELRRFEKLAKLT